MPPPKLACHSCLSSHQVCRLPPPPSAGSTPRVAVDTRGRTPRPVTRSQRARLPLFSTALRDSPLRFRAENREPGALGEVSLASGGAGQFFPASLPPQPAPPEARTTRPPRPTKPRAQNRLRFVRDCHEGCFRFQTQELLSAMPPRCRIPLPREPSANGDPAASSQASCRGRYTVGLRRPGALKITAPCGPDPGRACHAGC